MVRNKAKMREPSQMTPVITSLTFSTWQKCAALFTCSESEEGKTLMCTSSLIIMSEDETLFFPHLLQKTHKNQVVSIMFECFIPDSGSHIMFPNRKCALLQKTVCLSLVHPIK